MAGPLQQLPSCGYARRGISPRMMCKIGVTSRHQREKNAIKSIIEINIPGTEPGGAAGRISPGPGAGEAGNSPGRRPPALPSAVCLQELTRAPGLVKPGTLSSSSRGLPGAPGRCRRCGSLPGRGAPGRSPGWKASGSARGGLAAGVRPGPGSWWSRGQDLPRSRARCSRALSRAAAHLGPGASHFMRCIAIIKG